MKRESIYLKINFHILRILSEMHGILLSEHKKQGYNKENWIISLVTLAFVTGEDCSILTSYLELTPFIRQKFNVRASSSNN